VNDDIDRTRQATLECRRVGNVAHVELCALRNPLSAAVAQVVDDSDLVVSL
jgi:hypothetical protein